MAHEAIGIAYMGGVWGACYAVSFGLTFLILFGCLAYGAIVKMQQSSAMTVAVVFASLQCRRCDRVDIVSSKAVAVVFALSSYRVVIV